MNDPYNIYGGLQCHDSWRVPSNSWSGQVTLEDSIPLGWGDGMYNVVDPENFHLANGPAVYKMIMTDPRFGDDIHGRRTGCMAAGGMFLAVMRYMGFPARWMGTSQQRATSMDSPYATGDFYDLNQDGMFNGDDYMDASHGHYTNEVYLGPGYGWQRSTRTSGPPTPPGPRR